MGDSGLQPLNIFLIVFPFVVSLTLVGTRIWRRCVDRQFATEDAILLVAEALIVVLTGTEWKYVLVSYSGYHAEHIPKGAINQSDVLYWRKINNDIYNPILSLAKISFLITLLKLRSSNRLINISLYSLIVVNTLFMIAATLGSILMCLPVHKSWHPNVPGKCGKRKQYIIGVISVTIATDVLVTIVPAWILHGLQMSRKNKLSVIAFLSLPLAVTAIGCYRLYAFVKVFSLPALSAEDPYNVRNALSNIESNLAVIAVCGPTIKWLLSFVFPYFRADSTRPSNAYTTRRSSRLQSSFRGYQKSNHDIELEVNEFDHVHVVGAGGQHWKSKGDDAASDEERITAPSGIKKTVVVDWNVSEAQAPSSTPGLESEQPRTMV